MASAEQPRPTRTLRVAVLINLALAAVVAYGLITNRGEIQRRISYRLWGSFQVDGITICLPPDDPFLEYLLDHGHRAMEATLETVLRRELRPGDTFIDAGANVGWFTLIAARIVGEHGRVIAFEPEPRNFAVLKRNVALNGFKNVVLEPRALSDKNGTIRLNLSETNENHSIAVLGGQHGSIEVESVRLDDYLADRKASVRCIKIDTEGAEGLILAGMGETLSQDRELRLVIEFDPFLLRAAGTDAEALLRRLREAGLSIRKIDERARRVELIDDSHLHDLAAGGGCNLLLARDR